MEKNGGGKKMIDHKNRYIYVRTPKAASTSILGALYQQQTTHFFTNVNKEFRRRLINVETYWEGDRNHYPLSVMKKIVHPQIIKNYFKFSFVRNPWARVFSAYNYEKAWHDANGHELVHHIKGDFNEYVENYDNWYKTHKTTYFEYTEGCDFIGKMENLQNDFDEMCSLGNLKTKTLKHLNVTDKKIEAKGNFFKYRDHYTSKTKDIIYKKFKKDIEFFEYEY